MKKILKVASLFCGCGGMDLGLLGGFSFLGKKYPGNGFKIVFAADNDKFCTQLYNANFKTKCLLKDVKSVSGKDIPDHDILTGGFPCQPFSITAQNPPRLRCQDPKGMLFAEMVRILSVKKPEAFIAENVKGILSANKGSAFTMIMDQFKKAGYHIKHFIVNAVDFGVPQKRERVIIIGFRNEKLWDCFSFPEKCSIQNTLKDVLDSCENDNESLFFSEKAVAGMKAVKDKMNKGRAQNPDMPCNTVSSHLAKVSLNSVDPVLKIGERYRRFSCREVARIQSFPDTFLLDAVSPVRQYKALGNAVPPVMMWHIANSVRNAMVNHTGTAQ